MTSLSYFKGFSVVRTATVTETAELIWAMANKMQKEFEKGKPIPSYARAQVQVQTQVQVNTNVNTNETQESIETENILQTENVEKTELASMSIPTPASYGNFVKKSKRENITPENIGEILLSQIPGISNHIATEILKHFDGSFTKLIDEIRTNPGKLDTIYLESNATVTSGITNVMKRRKLSIAVIQSILRYLVNEKISTTEEPSGQC
jgi:ERCC4-type nuclease